MRDLLKLMRIKHYLKNGLIFLPLFFGGLMFKQDHLIRILIGFVSFSMMASAVYVFNDLMDIKEDRLHATKRLRPLASGAVKKPAALLLLCFLILGSLLSTVALNGWQGSAIWILMIYFGINILYSLGLKELAILDVVILVSGFLLRIYYGASITGIIVSDWLYLMIMSIAFYMALGKRRNEMNHEETNSRKVLSKYTSKFLDNNMHLFLIMTLGFYALWCIDPITMTAHPTFHMIWTMPLVSIIVLRYDLDIETHLSGDPVEIILKDKLLMGMAFLFIVLMGHLLY